MGDLITADVGCALESGRDVVHCVSLALAWQQLVARFGPLQMEPQPPTADALNAPLDPACIEPSACMAVAGFGREGVLARVRTELAERFPHASPELLPASLPDGAMLAYAYLTRALPFGVAFDSRETVFLERRVAAFGVEGESAPGERMRAQVRVHDYLTEDDFVIELLPEDRSERILVAPMPRPATLGNAVQAALGRLDRLQGTEAMLGDHEPLLIPCVALDEAVSFADLQGRPLGNPGLNGAAFDVVRQSITFSLDENGARLTSEGVTYTFGRSRAFEVGVPFLVMLLRQGSRTPYLSAWVETTAWMQDRGAVSPPPVGFGGFGFGPPPSPG